MKKKILLSLSLAFLGANLATAGLYILEDETCVPVNLSCGHAIICGDSLDDIIDQALDADAVFCP